MTKALEHAFAEASKLPNEQQDAIAAILLDEIASERRWDESFVASQDRLAEMAREARKEFEEGKTLPFEKDSDLAHD